MRIVSFLHGLWRLCSPIVCSSRFTLAALVVSVLLLSTLPAAHAEDAKTPKFVSGVLDFPLSNYYLTPRGIIVEDEGLIAQPSLFLSFNLYESDGPLSNVTATLGIWNSVHTKKTPSPNTKETVPNWNEVDFVWGLGFTLLKDWTFGITYQYWISPVDAFDATSILEMTFAYTDHFLEDVIPSGKFSLNPYMKIFIELVNKATAATEESFNFELGFIPKYVLDSYPLSIELPTFVTFPGSDFYSESSVPGLVSTGLKVTAPLTFVPERYGTWKLYAGFLYYHFFNDGIVEGNLLQRPASDNRDPVQFIGGFSLSF